MKISIFLKDNFGEKEIIKEINENDYEEFKEDIMKGKVKFIDINNQLIKISEIKRIEPTGEQIIPERFRLQEPKFEKIDDTKGMEKLFNLLRLRGLFKEFNNYQGWCEVKYAKKI